MRKCNYITQVLGYDCVINTKTTQVNAKNVYFVGGGLVIGGVISLLFLKRRAWPLIMGTGLGFGVAFRNCETELNK